MSWNAIYLSDIDIKLKKNKIIWRCPRCDLRQETRIKLRDLQHGLEISCQNVNICGERQAFFEASLNIVGSSKGLNDRPLN